MNRILLFDEESIHKNLDKYFEFLNIGHLNSTSYIRADGEDKYRFVLVFESECPKANIVDTLYACDNWKLLYNPIWRRYINMEVEDVNAVLIDGYEVMSILGDENVPDSKYNRWQGYIDYEQNSGYECTIIYSTK